MAPVQSRLGTHSKEQLHNTKYRVKISAFKISTIPKVAFKIFVIRFCYIWIIIALLEFKIIKNGIRLCK